MIDFPSICSASWLFFCAVVGQFEEAWPWHVTFRLLCSDVWQGQTNVLWFATATFYAKLCKSYVSAITSRPHLGQTIRISSTARWPPSNPTCTSLSLECIITPRGWRWCWPFRRLLCDKNPQIYSPAQPLGQCRPKRGSWTHRKFQSHRTLVVAVNASLSLQEDLIDEVLRVTEAEFTLDQPCNLAFRKFGPSSSFLYINSCLILKSRKLRPHCTWPVCFYCDNSLPFNSWWPYWDGSVWQQPQAADNGWKRDWHSPFARCWCPSPHCWLLSDTNLGKIVQHSELYQARVWTSGTAPRTLPPIWQHAHRLWP